MKATKEQISTLGRLQKRSDFLRVSDNKGAGPARKWVAKSMTVLILPNTFGHLRYGITATKRLEKSAVGRNRMKRRLRAAICDVFGAGAPFSFDLVLIARSETASRPYPDLCGDLRWCLGKLGHAV